MIELAKHIEILLLENDCVIVPELGGFIAHYQSACYVESENLFLPPERTVGFNPQLTINDGLLAQSYMQVHHTDFPDATRMIAAEVQELKEILYKEGSADINGIGRLCYTIHDSFEFHPCESGVVSPTLYGLATFSIGALGNNSLPAVASSTQGLSQKPDKKDRELHIGHRWIGNAVAIAASILLFFFLSVPVENTYIDKGNYASLGTDGLFDAIRSRSMATAIITADNPQQPQRKNRAQAQTGSKSLKPVAIKVEKVDASAKTPERASAPASTQEKKVAASPQKGTKPSNRYFIIVSSLATAGDAQRVLDDYKQKGYKEASIVEGDGRYRLALYGFPDKTAAYNKLNQIKQNETFQNAWLLVSK